METFTNQYEDLNQQLREQIKKLLEWKGEESQFMDTACLPIDHYKYEYKEITIINERVTLLDKEGNHYFWEVMETERICELVDQLSIFNRHANRSYPLRKLRSNFIDLSTYPNFHISGSIRGMKKLYYGKAALLVKSGSYIYNVTSSPHIYFEHSV